MGVSITPDYAIGQGLYPKLGYMPEMAQAHTKITGVAAYTQPRDLQDESTEPADAGDPVTRTPDLQPLGGLREDPGRGNHQGACL